MKEECDGLGAKYEAPDDLDQLYFREDIHGQQIFHLIDAVNDWKKEIDVLPSRYFDTHEDAIKYHGYSNYDNYLKLVRADTTRIGCAEVHCQDDGRRSYRVFCLMNNMPLKSGDVVYQIGKGGCTEDDASSCPDGSSCERETGLCKMDEEQ
ncbi:hypothetical protein OESDEN_17520 [Oesophagostomum dentatum]|uniref:SCP domain-containing protein n=1 Tax=Oesophagostomum dentatum TaxID=61180 RepID=A0A0B1SHW1_OESDE|nr:hypothetical protein OESDEN_17520 [Oesophagostomum dentatum]